MKTFNTTGVCIPEKHYMVDLSERLRQIKSMIDAGQYFTINRARQYGKTTTLAALTRYLSDDYIVVDLDFQDIGDAGFADENDFCRSFATIFADSIDEDEETEKAFVSETRLLGQYAEEYDAPISLLLLFRKLQKICAVAEKPVVLMIDEVDSATNNQVFLDFLAQLRSLYLKREKGKNVNTFQSVILAGVTDVKNLKRKIRPDDTHKFNSPWNIATAFTIDMRLHPEGIQGMLDEYDRDHHTGMDTGHMARSLFAYTDGYPFLVSRLCQIMDQEIPGDRYPSLAKIWTEEGLSEAFRRILLEQNTLFESLMTKVYDNEPLQNILQRILFGGERIPYNPDTIPTMDADMYGFIKYEDGALAIANRIFETRLYNYFLSVRELADNPISRIGANERDSFIIDGHLQMDRVLTRYMTVFDDICEGHAAKFDEDEGRRRFLLLIRPIINGTGNYYIEAETRNNERMDLVIDYLGERHVVELKIWRGQEYHKKGERQLASYLDHYHLGKGYLLTYDFRQKKKARQQTVIVNDKVLEETFV